MTANELRERLSTRPKMCQTWIDARALYDDGGVLYLSSISDGETERTGTIHIYIWGKSAMGHPDAARLAAIDLMETHELYRIFCQINRNNHLAINLAERGGMKKVGIIRQRKNGRGGRHDVMLMDAMLPDLRRREWATSSTIN